MIISIAIYIRQIAKLFVFDMYKLLSPSKKSYTYIIPFNNNLIVHPNQMIFRFRICSSSQGPNHNIRTNKACRQSQGFVWLLCGALRRGRHELDRRRQGRGGRRRARLRAAIREREAPTVQTSGQKHLSSTLTLNMEHGTQRIGFDTIKHKEKYI